MFRTICESIRVMCATVLQNRLICCRIGLITDILNVLQKCLELESATKGMIYLLFLLLVILCVNRHWKKIIQNLFSVSVIYVIFFPFDFIINNYYIELYKINQNLKVLIFTVSCFFALYIISFNIFPFSISIIFFPFGSDCLISIMEILGCLSITSSELKLLISLFHRKTQVPYYDSLRCWCLLVLFL